MTVKFTCYVPKDIGNKLKKLQDNECLNISKFITKAIVAQLTKSEEKNK